MDLDAHLQPKGGVVVTRFERPLPWQLGVTQTIQQNRVRSSQVNLKNFVVVSGTAGATGAIGNGTTLTLSTTLTPNVPHQSDVNFADPYIAIYQGTAALSGNQIYPVCGGSITPGLYTVQGALDYNGFGTANPQAFSIWKGNITDNSAGNQTILFTSVWKWLNYTSGSVT